MNGETKGGRVPVIGSCPRCRGSIAAGEDVLFPVEGGVAHVRCRSRAVPGCAACRADFGDGERLVYEGDKLFHTDCYEHACGGPLVREFLERHAGRAFCHRCLAHRLGVGPPVVLKVSWALRAMGGYRFAPGRCAICERSRVTIALVEPEDARDRPAGHADPNRDRT
jgi:hypothetical protein